MKKLQLAPLAFASLALAACQTTGPRQGGNQWSDTGASASGDVVLVADASSNPCAESERQKEAMGNSIVGALVGSLGGAALGAVLDRVAGNRDHTLMKLGAIAGLAAGAIKGYNNGVDTYRRQCEVFKAAQARNTRIAIATVRVANQPAGEIVVNPARGFFHHGSDQLTPAGVEYFREQGRQYNAEVQLAGYEQSVRDSARRDSRLADLASFRADDRQKRELSQRWRNMRIILTGHVDDRSGAQDPVQLSERRARNVADVFRSQGVPAEILYFEGAGSALPIADNNTEAGRERNNRVEVAVFYDERQLTPYTEARQTDHRLFSKPAAVSPAPAPAATPRRPAAPPVAAPPPVTATPPLATVPRVGATPPDGAPPARLPAPAAAAAAVRTGIEFGGRPVAGGMANVADAIGPVQSSRSILSVFGLGEAVASSGVAAPNCLADDANRYRRASAKRLSDSAALAGKAPIAARDAYLYIVKRSYSGAAGEHYVHLADLTLSKSGELAEQPTFNVYKGFERMSPEEKRRASRADISQKPVAFAVRGEKGVLVRQFFADQESTGLVCMDMVLPNDQRAALVERTALVYTADGVRKVANFPLKFQGGSQ